MYSSKTSSISRSRRTFLLNSGRMALATAAMAKLSRNQSVPSFTEHRIPRNGFDLYAREYNGAGPAFVLLHGFPDDLHIYDRLVPLLVERGRRVVAFDFLGFGASDKPAYSYTFEQQKDDLLSVVEFLRLDGVIPVAHDAGGVAAIDFALSERKTNPCSMPSEYVLRQCANIALPGVNRIIRGSETEGALPGDFGRSEAVRLAAELPKSSVL